MEYKHIPVLLKEAIEGLNLQPNFIVVDCTLGGASHSLEILNKTSPNGKLIGIDLDPEAIKNAKVKLKEHRDRVTLVNENYIELKKIIYDQGLSTINAVLLDLGVSSFQLDQRKSGFSFKTRELLDMRMGEYGTPAYEILNKYSEQELKRIFKEYGEERHSGLIAKQIVSVRKKQPIKYTNELVEIILKFYKKGNFKIHPATKIFQALRIEANQELESLKQVLPQALKLLESGGRIAVISFHSLEDKIVKEFFKEKSKNCICPKEIPVCQCNHKAEVRIITKKPIVPTEDEIDKNIRARSAKLRIAEKL